MSRPNVLMEACHTLPSPLSPLPKMTRDQPSLGRCPNCSEEIPRAWMLIEYETADGTTDNWAECLACDTVVSPE